MVTKSKRLRKYMEEIKDVDKICEDILNSDYVKLRKYPKGKDEHIIVANVITKKILLVYPVNEEEK